MTDLLEDPADEDVLSSRLVRGLLAGLEDRDTLASYGKWHGAHWRLVSLVELGHPARYEPAVRAAEAVLDYWAANDRLARVRVVAGRPRIHAGFPGRPQAVRELQVPGREPRAHTARSS